MEGLIASPDCIACVAGGGQTITSEMVGESIE